MYGLYKYEPLWRVWFLSSLLWDSKWNTSFGSSRKFPEDSRGSTTICTENPVISRSEANGNVHPVGMFSNCNTFRDIGRFPFNQNF